MITSTKNPRIVDARKLTQRKHRLRQNRFLVEGLQLLTMAVQTAAAQSSIGHKINPLEVFYSEELFAGETAARLLSQLTQAGATPIAVAPHVLDSMSARDTAQGLIATFALSKLEGSLNELAAHINPLGRPRASESAKLLLILDQLQDPGNLGTLIRTADAVGAGGVLLLEPCVDPFDPKTVRGSMGSLFTVPFVRTAKLDQVFASLSAWGYRPVGADAARGRPFWLSDVLGGSVALVLGNEARGLSSELHQFLADYVALPLQGQAESLNVAVAGGVLMYEWLRVNA